MGGNPSFCFRPSSSFAMGPIPEACLVVVGVAASASEPTADHSLALAATRIGRGSFDLAWVCQTPRCLRRGGSLR